MTVTSEPQPIPPMPWDWKEFQLSGEVVILDAIRNEVVSAHASRSHTAAFIVMLVNAAHAAGLDPARVVSDPDYHRAIVKALLEVSR